MIKIEGRNESLDCCLSWPDYYTAAGISKWESTASGDLLTRADIKVLRKRDEKVDESDEYYCGSLPGRLGSHLQLSCPLQHLQGFGLSLALRALNEPLGSTALTKSIKQTQ